MRSPTLGMIPGLSRSEFPREFGLGIFEQTCRNRANELSIAKMYDDGQIKVPIYLSIGQEHIPASIAAVSKDFLIFAQHRAHSWFLSFVL